MSKKIKYIALEGGGLKGIAHLGVIQFLMETGLWGEVDTLSGSSAGALAALIGATGWDFKTMYQRFKELDLHKMITTDSKAADIPIVGLCIEMLTTPYHALHNLRAHYGLHKAEAVEEWIESVVSEVTGIQGCNFEQWHALRMSTHPHLKDIVVEAGNLSTRFNETFSWKTEHKDVPIARAMRASMAFPLYLAPVEIKGSLYIDGGLLSNCPGQVFEKKRGIPHKKLLCIMLEDKDMIEFFLRGKAPVPQPVHGLLAILSRVFSMMLGVQTNAMRTSPYLNQTVFCDTKEISTFDFQAVAGREEELIESGLFGAIVHFFNKMPDVVHARYDSAIIEKALANTVAIDPVEPIVSSSVSSASEVLMPLAPSFIPGFNATSVPSIPPIAANASSVMAQEKSEAAYKMSCS